MGTQALHPAIEFLQHLDPSDDAVFNLQHHTDLPSGKERLKHDPLLGLYSGLNISAVEKLLPTLHAFNERGAGVFVARNRCHGNREAKNITKILGPHADLDHATQDDFEQLVKLIPPSIIVESSPGRYQLYWQLVDGETLSPEETKAINQHIVQKHAADKAAVDVSRLLRLPGFKHMKNWNVKK
jgi:hypothetical protein